MVSCRMSGKVGALTDRTSIFTFDPDQAVENLLMERYPTESAPTEIQELIRGIYYGLRPLLSVGTRKHLQRFYLSGWRKIPFPYWPVDFTVERIFEQLPANTMSVNGVNKIPFILFWPNGYEIHSVKVAPSPTRPRCERL
jgi:hypothetical protein